MPEDLIDKTMRMPKWAVVGASTNPERTSYKIVELLRDRGYTVYPVSPKIEEVHGLRCYKTVEDLPETPDVIDMVVNPFLGIKAMRQIAAIGTKYVWLQPGTESQAIFDYAAEHGIEIVEGCILATLAIHADFRID